MNRVGKDHSLAFDYIVELRKNNIDTRALDLGSILQIETLNSDIEIVSVMDMINDEKIIAYKKLDQYFIITTQTYDNIVEYRTLDNNHLLTIIMDPFSNEITIGRMNDNILLNNFNDHIFSLSTRSTRMTRGVSCCRKEESVSDCANCTLNELGVETWFVEAALWIGAPELMLAIYGSCIGAGPDANC